MSDFVVIKNLKNDDDFERYATVEQIMKNSYIVDYCERHGMKITAEKLKMLAEQKVIGTLNGRGLFNVNDVIIAMAHRYFR